MERFKSLGVKKMLVPCMGCYKCFKYAYPDLLGSIDFEVQHVLDPILEKLKNNPSLANRVEGRITFQDPCRLSRGEKATEAPRELLKLCGAQID